MPRPLEHLGINEYDIARRPVVAVGFYPGELLPHTTYNPAPNYKEWATGVLRYLQATPPSRRILVRKSSDIEDYLSKDVRERFESPEKVIEVVGMYASDSVVRAIGTLTKEGYVVYVDPAKTFNGGQHLSEPTEAMMQYSTDNGYDAIAAPDGSLLFFNPEQFTNPTE